MPTFMRARTFSSYSWQASTSWRVPDTQGYVLRVVDRDAHCIPRCWELRLRLSAQVQMAAQGEGAIEELGITHQ